MDRPKSITNHFFTDNAVPDVRVLQSHSSSRLRSHSQMAGRVSSSAKLNPRTFQHREVFNSTLYKGKGIEVTGSEGTGLKKFFNFHIPIQGTTGIAKGYLQQAAEVLRTRPWQQDEVVRREWKAVEQNLRVIEKYLAGQEARETFGKLMASIERWLLSSDRVVQELLEKKRQIENQLVGLRRQSKNLKEQEQWVSKQYQRLQSKPTKHSEPQQKVQKLKAQLNTLQFTNKILLLQKDKFHNQKESQISIIQQLTIQNTKMKQQIGNIAKWKQEYEYKIRKLKEELEVAHIVKDQNLEEKVKYILSHNT